MLSDPRSGIRHVIPGKGNYIAGSEPPAATQAGLTLATG